MAQVQVNDACVHTLLMEACGADHTCRAAVGVEVNLKECSQTAHAHQCIHRYRDHWAGLACPILKQKVHCM